MPSNLGITFPISLSWRITGNSEQFHSAQRESTTLITFELQSFFACTCEIRLSECLKSKFKIFITQLMMHGSRMLNSNMCENFSQHASYFKNLIITRKRGPVRGSATAILNRLTCQLMKSNRKNYLIFKVVNPLFPWSRTIYIPGWCSYISPSRQICNLIHGHL